MSASVSADVSDISGLSADLRPRPRPPRLRVRRGFSFGSISSEGASTSEVIVSVASEASPSPSSGVCDDAISSERASSELPPRRRRRRRRRFLGCASPSTSASGAVLASEASSEISASTSASSISAMIEASTDTTAGAIFVTTRDAVLNFSMLKSGLTKVGSPSMRTDMPYRASICAMCSRFIFIKKLAIPTGHFTKTSLVRPRTPSSSSWRKIERPVLSSERIRPVPWHDVHGCVVASSIPGRRR